MTAALPILGLHPDYAEAQDEALQKAIEDCADDALSMNGLADEVICGPAVTTKWALSRLRGRYFDASEWLDDDGTFNEQLPRDDCPGDVLQMFLWVGSDRQALRAVHLLRDMARRELATDRSVIERAERMPLHVRPTKAFTLAHYSGQVAGISA